MTILTNSSDEWAQIRADYGWIGPWPKIAGSYKGKGLVICGDAIGVWDDLERLGCRKDGGNAGRGSVASDFHFMTINKLVETFPGDIEHCYSNEMHLLEKFIAARRNEYRKEFEGPKHAHSISEGAKNRWPFGGHGTSGLGACLVGLGLGYDKIVLCGVPLDNGPHNGEPSWRRCTFTREASSTADNGPNNHWRRARDLIFRGRVKSMSGRTREWLGEP